MAARDFASIDTALATIFANEVANQINRAVVAFQVLPCIAGDGKNVAWDAKFGTAAPTTAPIADGTAVTVFNADTKVPATLQFTTYHDAFTITGRAAAAAQAAGNPAQLANIFRDELTDSINRLTAAIGTDFYLGTGTSNAMLGLLDATSGGIIDSGTYAGIDRSSRTQWKGNVVDAATAALSFTHIRDLRRKIYVASGKKPDLFICDPTQHEKLGLLYNNFRRYVDQITVRGQTIKLDGGYQVLEFDGIPVIEDVLCPAQTFIGLNSREVRMRYLPPAGSGSMQESVGEVGLVGTEEEQFGVPAVRMMGQLIRLAKTGDAENFMLKLYPTPQVRSPNANGYIKNLAA